MRSARLRFVSTTGGNTLARPSKLALPHGFAMTQQDEREMTRSLGGGIGGTKLKPKSEEARVPRPGPEVHLDEWVAPDIADDHGYLRAGKILEWMDVVGVARGGAPLPLPGRDRVGRWARAARADPRRRAGDDDRARSRTRRSGASGSRSAFATARGAELGHPCVGAYMTFVALDDDGSADPRPAVLPETPAEHARFREGELRREFRKRSPPARSAPTTRRKSPRASRAGGPGRRDAPGPRVVEDPPAPADAVGPGRAASRPADAPRLVHPQDRADPDREAELPRHPLRRDVDALARRGGVALGAGVPRREPGAADEPARTDVHPPGVARFCSSISARWWCTRRATRSPSS